MKTNRDSNIVLPLLVYGRLIPLVVNSSKISMNQILSQNSIELCFFFFFLHFVFRMLWRYSKK